MCRAGRSCPATPTCNDALIDALVAQRACAERAAFLRFEPDVLENDPTADSLRSSLRRLGFKASERTLQPRSTIRLDLTPD